MPLDEVFDYFRSYDKASYAVFACQGNEPTMADVEAFEEGVAGFRLPDVFRDYTVSPLGGLYMEAREEVWPRAQAFDVGPAWSFLYGLQVYGLAPDAPDWLDIRVETQRFRTEGITDLVPCIRIVGDADRYCFEPSGRIVRWCHDDPEHREPEALEFLDLLMREIHELEDRLARKQRGEDR